jgi:hypothetical protein
VTLPLIDRDQLIKWMIEESEGTQTNKNPSYSKVFFYVQNERLKNDRLGDVTSVIGQNKNRLCDRRFLCDSPIDD